MKYVELRISEKLNSHNGRYYDHDNSMSALSKVLHRAVYHFYRAQHSIDRYSRINEKKVEKFFKKV